MEENERKQLEESSNLNSYITAVEHRHQKRMYCYRLIQVLGLLAVVCMVLITKTSHGHADSTDLLQQGIADEIIRFHVLANSDRPEDQALKLKVKQEVVEYLQSQLVDCTSRVEAEKVLASQFTQIKMIAKEVIAREGYTYEVEVELAPHYFPVKVYGDLVFPEGEYDALRVLIGEAEGKNWWCVMYPSLCMVNETYSVVPEESKETLKTILTEEEYEAIDENGSHEAQTTTNEDSKVTYHWWIVDALSKLF